MIRKVTVNMKGLKKWMKENPNKNYEGYFDINGKPMTHDQVVLIVYYAIEKGYKTEADIPSEDLEFLFGKEGDEK